MHHGWWPTSPSCRWVGRRTTPGSWPPTTRRTCPVTASPQAAGTATAPAAWGCRAKHRWPGSRPCSRAATPTPTSSSAAPTARRGAGVRRGAGIRWLRTPSTGPPTSGRCPGRSESNGHQRMPTATASSRACPRIWCEGSPSAPARSMPSWTGWPRTVRGGRRGWSSGLSTPPASLSSTRRRTPCTGAGGPRRPSAGWTRTPWSGR
jgi:hypothetical protein